MAKVLFKKKERRLQVCGPPCCKGPCIRGSVRDDKSRCCKVHVTTEFDERRSENNVPFPIHRISIKGMDVRTEGGHRPKKVLAEIVETRHSKGCWAKLKGCLHVCTCKQLCESKDVDGYSLGIEFARHREALMGKDDTEAC